MAQTETGQITGTLSSTAAGTKTVTATVNGTVTVVQTANVTVVVAQASNVLVVPNSAITRIGTRAFVNVLQAGGKEVRKLVTLGVAGDTPVRDNHITPNCYGAVGVNVNIPVFNGFLYNARAKAADLQTEADRQRLRDLQDRISRDVRVSWQDINRAYERLSVTQQLREQAALALDLAQGRYNVGLASIVELTQAELQKTEADIADADATYQYRLTQLVLAFTIAAPR